MSFTISAISTAAAETLRRDPTARRVVLDDAGTPCRHCLQLGQTGEAMLLLTYQPFTGAGPYAVPSPVYVHADACPRYDPTSGLPALARSGLRAVRSYTENHDLLDGVVVPGTELEHAIATLFEDPTAAYLHAHSATAGCFTFRVDRAA